MIYLEHESYYNNLYDRFTIEQCRRTEKSLSKAEYNPKLKKGKKEIAVTIDLSQIPIYFITGERYLKKAEAIRKWMDRDVVRDNKIKDACEPRNIFCSSCGSSMEVTMRNLNIDFENELKNRVLFLFRCKKCNKGRGVYEDGIEWESSADICPKCNQKMNSEDKKEENKIITIYNCPGCNHKEKMVLDLDEKIKEEKVDPNFEKDRKRFCLTEEEGIKYSAWMENFKKYQELLEKQEEKDKNKELYDRLAKMKKLTIIKLQSLLESGLKKEGYINVDFSNPTIDRDVIVQFTAQDSRAKREEYDSKQQLRRLIKSTLEKTNWRLMSEGVNYRLGILSGRLRGYENEEDLLKLIHLKI
jgi:hypothetical protein